MARITTTIGQIHNLFEKYGDLNLTVQTPYGFKKIEACAITAYDSPVFEVLTKSYNLKCSPEHKIKTSNGKFVKTINLKPGMIVQTQTGNESIEALVLLPNKYDLYDIQVAEVRQYYSNGILSHNSSLLDILTYCIYDKCSRAWKAKDVLNNRKSKFKSKFVLELNHEVYTIERNGFKDSKKGTVKVEVDFYKIDSFGIKHNLNGDDRDGTNQIIRDYLGTYDDFLLTTLSTQNDNKNFIFKKQGDRKELLYSFLDLSVCEELQTLAKKAIKEKSDQLSIIESELTEKSTEFASLDSNIKISENSLGLLNGKLSENQLKIKTIQTSIDDCNKQLIPIPESVTWSDDSKIKLKTIIKEIEDLNKNLELNKNLIKDIQKENIELNNKLNLYDLNDITAHLKVKEDIEQKITVFTKDKETADNQIISVNNIIEKLKIHEYDPNCEYCIRNQFVKDAESAKETLPTLLGSLKLVESELVLLNNSLTNELKYEIQSNEYNNIQSEINDINSKKIQLENKILTIENSLTKLLAQHVDLQNQQTRYELHKTTIEKNNNILAIQMPLIKDLELCNTLIQKTQTEIIQESTKLQLFKASEIRKTELSERRSELDTMVQYFNAYIEMMSNDGIPYMLLQKILPVIETEVNIILSEMVNFSTKFESDDKNNINCYLVYTDDNIWPVEMASGMERFIVSLAIRCALVDITSLPRPIFMAIDEGFGTLDSDNISALSMLFEYMKTKFDYVIVVSHIDTMRDMVDGLISVYKNAHGFSEISLL